MSIAALDAAFEADVSAHAITNREMCLKMPVGSLVAIIALYVYLILKTYQHIGLIAS